MCTEILLFVFPSIVYNVKTVLSSWAVQTQVMGPDGPRLGFAVGARGPAYLWSTPTPPKASACPSPRREASGNCPPLRPLSCLPLQARSPFDVACILFFSAFLSHLAVGRMSVSPARITGQGCMSYLSSLIFVSVVCFELYSEGVALSAFV